MQKCISAGMHIIYTVSLNVIKNLIMSVSSHTVITCREGGTSPGPPANSEGEYTNRSQPEGRPVEPVDVTQADQTKKEAQTLAL